MITGNRKLRVLDLGKKTSDSLLLSPTAIITFTNIHLCCCLGCCSFLFIFHVIPSLFIFFSFLGNAILQSHTCMHAHTRFRLIYSVFAVVIVSFCALLGGVCLSKNKRITCLLTYSVL